ncbi:fatty-acid--CoA ligase [Rhodococcus sp. KBW08]|uniref:acyl-CoA synthetase n=1 Tax=Rhodococcus sp. KBW08 TaxID=2144188 RepID=UPI000F5B8354|nr:long-chain fatty acid--CoA ligase [Rhodococcus sp. KBW08]RQO46077.1 fatty-acid--CoA ligase [Rhodococcus sp. KBW08]
MTLGLPTTTRPAVDINPATAVRQNACHAPQTTVIDYPGYSLTYAELEDRTARLATGLTSDGVIAGDRVAYIGLNSPTFLITMLASFRIGAIFVPVNFRLAGPELQTVLDRSGAIVLIGEESHRHTIEAVRERTALKRCVLVDDDPEVPAPTGAVTGWEKLSDVLACATPQTFVVPATFDDPAILMYTSGTTGLPKGVTLTHGNIWWNSVNVDSRIDTRRGDVTYASAPLFHVGALNSFVLRTVVRGGTVLVRRSFDPSEFLEDLVEHRVNSVFAVPAMLSTLSRVTGVFDTDLTHLRSIVVAGAPVPPSLIRRYAEHDILLQQAWGLTETAPFATHLPVEHTITKIGSAGIPMPYNEVRVVDPATGQVAVAGVAGEIVVRGPNVTPGYWENPEATDAAFDSEGWFHSGDIGYLDDDGYLYIVDRLKDMVISGGENIYPAEVERVLANMPGISDVAVVGTPDDKWGEIVVAVVSADAGADPSLEDIRDFAARELARYKLPQRLRIVERVPRNASGKLEKSTIRELVGEGDRNAR